MTVHYRTQGFILQKIDSGEADRFYFVYTKDFGKLKILAKAVRKIKSKLKSHLEPFTLSEIEFIQGRNQKTFTDAEAISRGFLKNDLTKLKICFDIAELFDILVKGEEKDSRIWNILAETLGMLGGTLPSTLRDSKAAKENWKLRTIYHYFLWNFLSALGYQPQIDKCALCRRKISFPKSFFSVETGGTLCLKCAKGVRQKTAVGLDTLKILKVILRRDFKTFSRLKVEKEDLKNLEAISKNYLAFVLNQL